VARLPQINVKTSDGFTEGRVKGKLLGVYWSSADAWWVALIDHAPQRVDTQALAMKVFLDALVEMSGGRDG